MFLKRLNRGLIVFTGFFITLCFFTGCGPGMISMKILKPAEVDSLTGIKKIAVMDFEGTRGKEIAGKLVEKIVDNKFYQVVERERLEKLMDEQKLGMVLLDPEKTVQMGKLLGVDAFIFGNVAEYSSNDTGAVEEKKSKDKDGVQTVKYYFWAKRDAKAEISIKIASTETGEVLYAKTIPGTTQSQKKSVEFKLDNNEGYKAKNVAENISIELAKKGGVRNEPVKKQSSEDKAKETAISMLPSMNELLSPVVEQSLGQFVAHIAPHYVTELRAIEDSGAPQMKQAYELAKREMWDEAKVLWETVLSNPALSKAHAGANNNIGVYYETQGNLNRAEESFDTAYKLSGKMIYLDAKAKIQQRKKEQQKLQEQMGK